MQKKTQENPKLPCTGLAGFLDNRKTKLLNHTLQAHHDKRLAVIENEFGEVSIDDGLAERSMQTEEILIEMSNGCACCTVRGEGTAGLKN